MNLGVLALFVLMTSLMACKKKKPNNSMDEIKPSSNQEIIEGEIKSNKTLSANKQYLLRGNVRVMSGATLEIQAGTIIMGEKASKAALIIEMGGKIKANGTATNPIIFTSDQPAGEKTRNVGDWAGIIICGKSKVNTSDGTAQYEGGILGQGVASYGGGTNPDLKDNSGEFTFVRIEFAGIAVEKDKEINGLTLCAVGSGTIIHHVQVSYCGDDAFEFFGGTVNATHLIAYRSVDDDFDFDQGYTGNLQYGISIKDPNIVDGAGTSRGIELENKGAVDKEQYTRPVISNFTFLGPGSEGLVKHGAGVHFGLKSRMVLVNSIIVNAKGNAVEFNSEFTAAELKANRSLLYNNVIFGNESNFGLLDVKSFASIAELNDFAVKAGNSMLTKLSEAGLNSVSITNVDLGLQNSSPAINKANFVGDLLKNDLDNSFFTKETFAGAISASKPNWTTSWASWTPKTNKY